MSLPCAPRPLAFLNRFAPFVVLAWLVGACGPATAPTGGPPADGGAMDGGGTPDGGGSLDIAARLAQLPGLAVAEQPSPLGGYRFFWLTYQQPANHDTPDAGTFPQRLTLLHRDEAAPMVLFNSGYFVSSRAARAEPTRLVQGNQLSVEHRFFASSRPTPAHWPDLTIAQAAHDFHRLIVAFKAIYRGKWLSTGASKGGDTVVFHRRFHPEDVDGTIAYVAPINFASDLEPVPENRTIVFLENVGADAACRQKLRDFQRLALGRRDALLPLVNQVATDNQTSFEAILGADRALEIAVVELPFLFWQYRKAADCALIPDAASSTADLFQFLDDTSDLYSFSDQDLTDFLPYYHQSATELGWVVDDERHLTDLLRFPAQDRPRTYLPRGLETPAYAPAVMEDVDRWVKSSAARILFVYGAYDPWSASAFNLGNPTDSFRFYAAGGNHGSKLADLAPAEQTLALDAVTRWSGVSAVFPLMDVHGTPLQDEGADPLDEGRRSTRTSEIAPFP